jgi:hypothetical protein
LCHHQAITIQASEYTEQIRIMTSLKVHSKHLSRMQGKNGEKYISPQDVLEIPIFLV